MMRKMVNINLDRKASIDEQKHIWINSTVKEEMTPLEYKEMYARKAKELAELKEAIEQGKSQLKEIQAIEETPELKKLVENLKKAEKLKRKDDLVTNLQKFEVDVQRMQEELASLTPVMTKINMEKL
jgi:DNA repair exonuclease SbcCD ATPase subunit